MPTPTPAAARTSAGHPRRRLFAMALLLLLSLTLGAALALEAIQTARRHRQTAERALADYAEFASFILASRAYRLMGGDVVESLTLWTPPRTGTSIPEGTACPGGATFFDRLPDVQAIRFSGATLDPGALAFLTDTLKNSNKLLEEARWRFRYIQRPGGTGGWFIGSYPLSPGKFGLHGFSACLFGPESAFRQVMLTEKALPPSITGALPPDSMFSMTVAAGNGPSLYTSPVRYLSPFHGATRLGTEFGNLMVRVELNPGIANRLVIGGIPASPTPLAAALLGLSTLLVVTALFQLKREYELITIRSDFVSNVSHELRTPLSQILIFTELLKLGRLRTKGERDRSIDIIDQETRRLIRLVENVLQFSRSGDQRRRLEKETVPLGTLVRETVDAFRPLASARGVVLRAEVPANASVRADPGALRQILLNLLDNAVKYGPRGQTVSVAAETRNGRTRVMVEDQGPGIPPEDRERVWEGYYRMQREARSAVAGSGIGLAVVRALATEMAGTAWIEDAGTGGARFIVELASGSEAAP